MRRKGMLLFQFLLIISLATGCWSKRELNELAIATGIAVDKKGDEYIYTAQVLLPSELEARGGSSHVPVVTYRASGKTISEAARSLVQLASRQIYVGHLRVLIFGEELAREGIGHLLDVFSRYPELRIDFFLMVAKGTEAANVLNVLEHQEKIPFLHLHRSLTAAERLWAPTNGINLDDLIGALRSEGRNPVLTTVELRGPVSEGNDLSNLQKVSPPARLAVNGLAAFKKDRLVGYLNEEESKGYNFIDNHVTRTMEQISCKGGRAGVELMGVDSVVKGEYREGEKPRIHINIEAQGEVNEVSCDVDLSDPHTLSEFEREVERGIEHKIRNVIKKTQTEMKSDIFGFGEKIRRANPQAWKKLKQRWEQEYPHLPVTVKVIVELDNTRSILDPVYGGKKE